MFPVLWWALKMANRFLLISLLSLNWPPATIFVFCALNTNLWVCLPSVLDLVSTLPCWLLLLDTRTLGVFWGMSLIKMVALPVIMGMVMMNLISYGNGSDWMIIIINADHLTWTVTGWPKKYFSLTPSCRWGEKTMMKLLENFVKNSMKSKLNDRWLPEQHSRNCTHCT